MSIAVPVAEDPIVPEWGASVANQLNRMILLQTTADQSSNSGSFADITGLAFPVVSGRQYTGQLLLSYVVSATNQGLQLALSCPTGNVLVHVATYGNGAPNTALESRLAASGDSTSQATTDGTSGRLVEARIVYDCTADGTFKLQFRRGGTSGSTGVTIRKGSGGIILVSA